MNENKTPKDPLNDADDAVNEHPVYGDNYVHDVLLIESEIDGVNEHPVFGDQKMPNPRLIVLGEPNDFTEREFDSLRELITRKLRDRRIRPKSYEFQIRVEYKEKAK